MITAPLLFSGLKEQGNNHCYYCGALCDEKYYTKEYVKNTFTNRDIVKYPGSNYVCGGCVETFKMMPDEFEMIDGAIKIRESTRIQPRMFSWVIMNGWKRPATKAHLKILRETILNPPKPPFCIVLADSGQKQLLFRAKIAFSCDIFPIMLEDDIILVSPFDLENRIKIATKLCAAIGKPALTNCNFMQYAIRCEKYFGSIEPMESWLIVMNQPLSRLAAWLVKNKEESQNEYPTIERGGISSKISGTYRPVEKNG